MTTHSFEAKLAQRDFSAKTRKALAAVGAELTGTMLFPDHSNPLPWANAETRYLVERNGVTRALTHGQVRKLAGEVVAYAPALPTWTAADRLEAVGR